MARKPRLIGLLIASPFGTSISAKTSPGGAPVSARSQAAIPRSLRRCVRRSAPALAATTAGYADVTRPRRPADADEPIPDLVIHASTPRTRQAPAMPDDPRTGARRSDGPRRGLPARHPPDHPLRDASPRCSRRRQRLAAPGGPARCEQLRHAATDHDQRYRGATCTAATLLANARRKLTTPRKLIRRNRRSLRDISPRHRFESQGVVLETLASLRIHVIG